MSKSMTRAEWLRDERELWVQNDQGLYLGWLAYLDSKGYVEDAGNYDHDRLMSRYIRDNWREIDAVRKA